jgi:hypothetical protein
MAFDPVEWRLFVLDVGQSAYEWVNLVEHDGGGVDFGWPIREGSTCFAPHRDLCPGEGLTDPILEYGRVNECAVIGAQVLRRSGPAGARRPLPLHRLLRRLAAQLPLRRR